MSWFHMQGHWELQAVPALRSRESHLLSKYDKILKNTIAIIVFFNSHIRLIYI